MPDIRQLLKEVVHEMETLEHFADQEKWDDLVRRLKIASNT